MSTAHATERVDLGSSFNYDAALDDLIDTTVDQIVDELERSWTKNTSRKVAITDADGKPAVACIDGELRFLTTSIQIPRTMSRTSLKDQVRLTGIPKVVPLSDIDHYRREDFKTDAVHPLSQIDKRSRCHWCGDEVNTLEECACTHLIQLGCNQ